MSNILRSKFAVTKVLLTLLALLIAGKGLAQELSVEPIQLKNARIVSLRNALADDVVMSIRSAIARGVIREMPAEETPPGGPRRPGNNGLYFIGERSAVLDFVKITVLADDRANSLTIAAPAKAMPLLTTLVEFLDANPLRPAETRVFLLKNIDATLVRQLLQKLEFPWSDAVKGEKGLPLAAPQLRVAADAGTNCLIVSGSHDDLDAIDLLMSRIEAALVGESVHSEHEED